MEFAKLKECLEKHLKWLKGEDGGKQANLYGADLREADLREADLYGANLYGANLYGANLYGADLYGADLREADLYGANLYGANLYGAKLYGADLYGADLREADLYGADLREANLRGANLYGADLREADLREADLYGANLYGANLYGANLYGAKLYGANMPPEMVTKFFPLACPEDGAFIAWKKCGDCIVKLLIPADALRSSAFGRKCRASKAECLEIQNIDGTQTTLREVQSDYDYTFVYRIGQMATVENFDTDRTHECAHGIHFFITRQEAVDY